MKAKITKRLIESIEPSDKDIVVSDTAVAGFRCKVTPKGRRVYLFDYWWVNKRKRITMGVHGQGLTAEAARKKAIAYKGQLANGEQPKKARPDPTTYTVSDLASDYLEQHARPKKKPTSVKEDERYIDQVICPEIGDVAVDRVTREDIQRLHHKMRSTRAAANRCVALLSKMFNLAEKWGYRSDGSNPVRHVEKFKEKRIERFLSPVELKRLGEVLESEEVSGSNPYAIAAIRLLLFTGCRREEILQLKWDYVDLDAKCLRLPDSKTGAKTVVLSQPAIDILEGLKPIKNNPYVIPGQKWGQYMVGLPKIWKDIREKAGIPDVRLHDLRHTFASTGAMMGEGLPLIGALLGHADPKTTARYAHFATDPKREGADRIAGKLDKLINSKAK